MSSLNLCNIDDSDLALPTLPSALIDAFRLARGRFPESITVTEEQAKKFFFANNEIMNDFKGIPLHIETKSNDRAIAVKTVNGILSAMHVKRIRDAADVYSMLETTKAKFTGEKLDV